MKKNKLILLLWGISLQLYAQEPQLQPLPLSDMSVFKPQAGNWFLVGEVMMDPTLDIHHQESPKKEEPIANTKKSKKKPKTQAVGNTNPAAKPVTYQPGTGILLNMNNDTQKSHLISSWEHGDILLDLEVMVPKGSNSGIYLQGRYEVQLLDSWGIRDPAFSDIGGIYRNWETEKGKIYMGKAPITNAAKAPGLWQRFRIAFQAPRFDAQGKKISHARFIYVELNGVRIHENVEVPLPTGGPIENNEVAKGPLMIQGDHGPVAFRNIRYQLLEDKGLELRNISYEYIPGTFTKLTEFSFVKITKSGAQNQLSVAMPDLEDQFRMVYKGEIHAPEAGTYQFQIHYNGQLALQLGEQTILPNELYDTWWLDSKTFSLNLKAGANPFTLIYGKSEARNSPLLGLFSVDAFARPLHEYNSFPPQSPYYSPIPVKAEDKPRLLRAFLDFEGDRSRRLTHTLGVASPQGVHFIYDLKAANPVCVWQGEFIDATPMWNDRGDGSFRPQGAAQYLFTGFSVARLASPEAAFPSAMNEENGFKNRGYKIEESNGLPVFVYQLDTLELHDQLAPTEGGKSWERTVSIPNNSSNTGLYLKMAEGSSIQKVRENYYAIDQKYFIKTSSDQGISIRKINNKLELIAPIQGKSINYSILW
ncbi:MAG: family 16 glycoside hydrolase [Microscillaceae bacterium]|nr:family 16 glycoside hydrolase [Microscillaceae bacterium]